ncbi:MAG: SDR family oxidoreductase [Gemmatimonadetes bacterium]|nr:SDR family oxidoreductase [Gemmatimonadota bacterium]
MSAPFRGQVVIVTGASGGIGEQLALQLAAQGARLALAARRAEELERVARSCVAAGGEALVVATDVGDAASCRALVERTFDKYGRLDMLVNNAGLGMWAKVTEVADLSIFERVMRVNYLGAVYCTVAALPHLTASRGRILCISSLAGRTGVPLRSGYAASKHAMAGFFDSLRIELRGSGVSVTLVDPGFVGTGAQGRNLGASGAPLGHVPIDLQAAMAPDVCARAAIAAAAARRRELVMTLRGKIGLWLKLVAPAFIDGMAAKATARGK